jgi:hypothetical protein
VQALFRCIMRAHKRIDDVVAPACFSVPGSSRDYGFADYDGRRPDRPRTGADLENKWLTTLAARTRKFRSKIPD